MKRKAFAALLTTALALSVLSAPAARGFTASAVPVTPGQQLDFGDVGVDPVNGIRGTLERTIQFEVVPGEEFTFEMRLANVEEVPNTSHVELSLVTPEDSRLTLFESNLTLDAGERFSRAYSEFVPDDLQLYGRYTMKLMIDDQVADFFQFDMNDRGTIIVQWDDGVLANGWAFFDAGNKWAIRGCMPRGAVIDEVWVHVLSENDPFWPWPNAIHEEFEIHIYDDMGGGGLPGNLLFNSGPVMAGPTGEVEAAAGVPAPPNAFYIANHQLTPFDTCEGQGVDAAVDHFDQMYQEVGGVWSNEWTSGDYMIWAIGHVGDDQITVGNPPAR